MVEVCRELLETGTLRQVVVMLPYLVFCRPKSVDANHVTEADDKLLMQRGTLLFTKLFEPATQNRSFAVDFISFLVKRSRIFSAQIKRMYGRGVKFRFKYHI